MKIAQVVPIFTLASCAAIEGIKDSYSGAVEYGRIRGRQEVLRELGENKKKLDEIRNALLQVVLQKVQNEEYTSKDLKEMLPVVGAFVIAGHERGKLLQELEQIPKKDAISLESVDEGGGT